MSEQKRVNCAEIFKKAYEDFNLVSFIESVEPEFFVAFENNKDPVKSTLIMIAAIDKCKLRLKHSDRQMFEIKIKMCNELAMVRIFEELERRVREDIKSEEFEQQASELSNVLRFPKVNQ